MSANAASLAHLPRPRSGIEALIAVRAALSSLVATLLDGTVYRLVLGAARGTLTGNRPTYLAAAALGAAVGAATNFSLNRWWVFRSREKTIVVQAAVYLAGSLLALFVLEAVLGLLVEKLRICERSAWLPAKILVWAAFSYPFQRSVVFKERVS